jgi:hypothetical protein
VDTRRSLITAVRISIAHSQCQGSQAAAWLEVHKAKLMEVPYFHVVFMLPPRISAITYQNHKLPLKNDANNLGAICDAVIISKVEDWGKVKK